MRKKVMKGMAPNEDSIDARYRSMLIIWVAQIMSVVLFFLFTQFVEMSADRTEKNILSIVLAAVGTFSVIFSFVVKARLLRKSVEKQDPFLVQTAGIAARNFSEVPAL